MKTIRTALIEHFHEVLEKEPAKRVFTIERQIVELVIKELAPQ